MKLCSQCRQMKSVTEFYQDDRTASKLETRCKQCSRERTNARKSRSVEAALKSLCTANRSSNRSARSKRRRGLVHEITPEYLIELWYRQHGMCAVTGVPMTHIYGHGNVMTNASLDRIDNRIGYTNDNVRLVCFAVNVMRNSMTDDELYEWCRLIVERRE